MVQTISTAMMISWSWPTFIGPTSIIPLGKLAAGKARLCCSVAKPARLSRMIQKAIEVMSAPSMPAFRDRSGWNAI